MFDWLIDCLSTVIRSLIYRLIASNSKVSSLLLQVLFGYSNFCQLSLSVHGTLIALQEPYRRFQYEIRPTTWKREAVPKVVDIVSHSSMNLIIFGTTEAYERVENIVELQAAKKRMVAMCRFLIAALEALQAKYVELQHLADESYSLDGKECLLNSKKYLEEISKWFLSKTIVGYWFWIQIGKIWIFCCNEHVPQSDSKKDTDLLKLVRFEEIIVQVEISMSKERSEEELYKTRKKMFKTQKSTHENICENYTFL